jgi:phytanoyl-CoA hydroxylase
MVPTITQQHRQEMEQRGFTLFEDVFTPEEMAELATIVDDYEKRRQAELAQKADGTEGISRAGEITFNDHLAEQDDRVRVFVTRPEFVALTTAFLGPDTNLYWNQTVFKHPEGDKEFPWHQDDAYTPVVPAPYLTLWLAINDATIENGCVSLLPGSHKGGLRPHRKSPIGLVGHENDDPDQGVPVPVRAGSIACFWSLTLHRSAPNRSKDIRKAFVIQYAPVGLRHQASGEEVPNLIPVARNGVAA